MPATGGDVTELTELRPGEQSHRWPRVLPGARTLLYFVQGRQAGVNLMTPGKADENRRILDASVDAAYLPPAAGRPGSLLSVVEDRLVARAFDLASTALGPPAAVDGPGDVRTSVGTSRSNLSVANDGTMLYVVGGSRYQLSWFRGDGTLVGSAAAPDRYVSVQVSPTGGQVLAVVDAGVGVRDAWLLDTSRGTRTRITSENRGSYAAWSPDAEHIAFAGISLQTIVEKAPLLGAAERTVLTGGDMYPCSWARDGHILYVVSGSAGGYDMVECWRSRRMSQDAARCTCATMPMAASFSASRYPAAATPGGDLTPTKCSTVPMTDAWWSCRSSTLAVP